MKRYSIKIIGSAGVLSTGEILIKIIFENGFFIKAEREFPSLIKGGEHAFLIDFSCDEIFSNSKNFEYILDLDNSVLIKGRKVLAPV
jgi:Pyruvate/2-oxoacid:ferredoxin oxidoreductase gamma subunit